MFCPGCLIQRSIFVLFCRYILFADVKRHFYWYKMKRRLEC